MEPNNIINNRGLESIRMYGFFILIALLVINVLALGAMSIIENNELRQELSNLSESLPTSDKSTDSQVIDLPEGIIALRTSSMTEVGFHNKNLKDTEYLTYANPKNGYILMKTTESSRHEIRNFGIILGFLYFGEVILLLGWWSFIRSKVQQIFEVN